MDGGMGKRERENIYFNASIKEMRTERKRERERETRGVGGGGLVVLTEGK